MQSKEKENKFYVYVYLDPRKPGKYQYGEYSFDFEPFYVGKGKDRRYKTHLYETCLKQNSYKNNKIKNIIKETGSNPIIKFQYKKLTDKESRDLEMDMISVIGRYDKEKGPLTNNTNGGEGVSGRIMSEKNRKELSKRVKGENNPMWGKFGELNPFFGKKHTPETLNLFSEQKKEYFKNEENLKRNRLQKTNRKVKIDGIIYPSIAEAARQIGRSTCFINYRTESNKFPTYLFV